MASVTLAQEWNGVAATTAFSGTTATVTSGKEWRNIVIYMRNSDSATRTVEVDINIGGGGAVVKCTGELDAGETGSFHGTDGDIPDLASGDIVRIRASVGSAVNVWLTADEYTP